MTELFDLIDSLGFWIYFPILMLIAIPMMRYILRMGSDDDDDYDDDGEEVGSKVIPKRSRPEYTGASLSMNREKYGKVIRHLYGSDHDPNIITKKVKIKSNDTTEPILCPNCGVSVMTQWQKCYHCGELL